MTYNVLRGTLSLYTTTTVNQLSITIIGQLQRLHVTIFIYFLMHPLAINFG